MKTLRTWALALIVGALAVTAVAGAGVIYGEGVTLEKPVAIADLLARPAEFEGTTVRVDGVVTAVCTMRGCWMMLSDPDGEQGIRIKVEDGVIVFPPESVGRKASAEGVFQRVAPAAEHEKHADHGEGEKGEKHACSEEARAAEEAAVFQIAGVGAVIYE